jgi:hypothetical protein
MYLLLFQLARPEELKALLRHRGAEALTTASQVVEYLLERDVFLHRHKRETHHMFHLDHAAGIREKRITRESFNI